MLIVDQMIHFRSTYLQNVFALKIKEIDMNIQCIANKARFEFYTSIYNALRCQYKQESDIFMNHNLWINIVDPLCDRTHSQFGIVAIIQALMVVVNKEIWKAFLECCGQM